MGMGELMASNYTVCTPKKREAFLKCLAEGYSVSKAAAAAGVTRRTVYNWREADEDFARDWDAAIEAGTDLLEDEAKRRAYEGTEKPVFYQGVQCGEVQEYSDTLMIVLLKARRPDKYRELKDIKHSGLIQTQALPPDLSKLDDNDLAALDAITSKLAATSDE